MHNIITDSSILCQLYSINLFVWPEARARTENQLMSRLLLLMRKLIEYNQKTRKILIYNIYWYFINRENDFKKKLIRSQRRPEEQMTFIWLLFDYYCDINPISVWSHEQWLIFNYPIVNIIKCFVVVWQSLTDSWNSGNDSLAPLP